MEGVVIMNIKQLEKLIDDRHWRNSPVMMGIISLLKKQQKEIEVLKKNNPLCHNCRSREERI